MGEILKISPVIPVGGMIGYENKTLKVVCSTNSCRGCTFESSEGATTCAHSGVCFAHLRPDRKSVMFVDAR